MLKFSQTKIIPYQAEQLFRLVLDIESYPQFLPWCSDAIIIEKKGENIIADLILNFKLFTTKYRSLVLSQQDDNKYIIEVKSLEGPLQYLHNVWKFDPIDDNTIVSVNLEFSIKSSILEKMVSTVFDHVTQKTIDAFEKRAKLIYG